MNIRISLSVALAVMATSLLSVKSDAQYPYLGGAPYFGNFANGYTYPGAPSALASTYSIGSAGIYGLGAGFYPGFSAIGGLNGSNFYFNGLNNGFSGLGGNNPQLNNAGIQSNIFGVNGYGNGGYYGGGYYGDPTVAVGPDGAITPVGGNSGVVSPGEARNVYVIHGPTALRDSIDVDKLSNNQVKIRWSGDTETIKQMTFSVLDASRQTLQSRVITKMPAQATFPRGKTGAYYRIYIQYLDGAVRTVTASL